MSRVLLVLLVGICVALAVATAPEGESSEVAEEAPTTQCPPGVPMAMCKTDPCLDASCASGIEAKCSGYYCGGCSRKWHDADNNDVTDQCEPSSA